MSGSGSSSGNDGRKTNSKLSRKERRKLQFAGKKNRPLARYSVVLHLGESNWAEEGFEPVQTLSMLPYVDKEAAERVVREITEQRHSVVFTGHEELAGLLFETLKDKQFDVTFEPVST